MKNILTQYFWIFLVAIAILVLSLMLFPEKKNRLEFIEDDELVEVTPESVRIRKKLLTESARKRAPR